MFKICSSTRTKETNNHNKKDIELKNIKKNTYFPSEYKVQKYNDYELYNLIYSGPLMSNYKSIKHLFGEPQILECYKGPFSFELIWYIKFKDGCIASISKFFKYKHEIRNNIKWRICINRDKALTHIICLFI
jgi:hypothetical protein